MNLTISAPSINLSISMLFRIFRILSILTGPSIFLSICLSRMRRFFFFLKRLITFKNVSGFPCPCSPDDCPSKFSGK
jgi:hypothetical protein